MFDFWKLHIKFLRRYPFRQYLKAIVNYRKLQRDWERLSDLNQTYNSALNMAKDINTGIKDKLRIEKEALRVILEENAALKLKLTGPQELHIYHYLGEQHENNNIQ